MNRQAFFIIGILLIGLCYIAAGSSFLPPQTTNAWSEPDEIILPAENGRVIGTIQVMHPCAIVSRGAQQGTLNVLYVPERKLIWVGQPKQKYIAFSNAIVGIDSGMDRLIYDLQTNCVADAKEKAAFVDIAEKRVPQNQYKAIDLGEALRGLRGLSPFLEPGQDVRPARPATITDVRFQGDRLCVTLVGENKIEVRLTFSSDMTLIKGELNGKVVYPRGR